MVEILQNFVAFSEYMNFTTDFSHVDFSQPKKMNELMTGCMELKSPLLKSSRLKSLGLK